jgi:hypothetical protein
LKGADISNRRRRSRQPLSNIHPNDLWQEFWDRCKNTSGKEMPGGVNHAISKWITRWQAFLNVSPCNISNEKKLSKQNGTAKDK